jgi:predicted lipoprotein with Yx(FWY)xxD motif
MFRSLAGLKAGNGRLWMRLALPAAATAVALVVGCGSSGTSSGGPSGSGSGQAAAAGGLKTATIGGATVLTNGKGFTLYSFALDTAATSNCNGACAQNWPPVKGPVTAPGIKGAFGTIKRSDGSTQATFDGRPLYTFAADTAPGQAKGNGLHAFGGVWHEDTTSGSAAPAPASSPAPPGGGY